MNLSEIKPSLKNELKKEADAAKNSWRVLSEYRPTSVCRFTGYPETTNHYENTPMQYTENVLVVKVKVLSRFFFIFFLFLLKT